MPVPVRGSCPEWGYVMAGFSLSLHLNVRVKILVFFLFLSLLSLLVIGLAAISAVSTAGELAESGSAALGREAISESSAALLRAAGQDMLRIASDQAAVTDVIFSDTDATGRLLAVQAATLRKDPPASVSAPWYLQGQDPPLPNASSVYFAPGTPVTTESGEFRSLAGMAGLLRTARENDPDLERISLATDSGILWMYPGAGEIPAGFDPRTRSWYTAAIRAGGDTVWSEPYVDASGRGLVLTCSRSVPGKNGSWVIAMDVTIESVNDHILDLTLNGEGYPVLLDSTGVVLSRPGLVSDPARWNETFTPDDAFTAQDPALRAVAANMTAGRKGIERVMFQGAPYVVAYAPVTAMHGSFAVSKPVEEILAPVRETAGTIENETQQTKARIAGQTGFLLTLLALLSCLLVLAVVLLSWMLARIITRPVDALKAGAGEIGGGNLSYRVDLRTGDEFEELAGSFNAMASDLLASIENLRRTTAEKERYTREMEIAKEIQDSFIPESAPAIPGFPIAAATIPAMEIGGDFYDFIPVAGNRWGIAIADVSGKAISGALFMALSRTMLHISGGSASDPSAAVQLANRWIYEDGRSSMFVTVFYGILDPADRSFTYVNAGHNPPLLVRDGDVQELGGGRGIALGVVPDVPAAAPAKVTLRNDDLLVLYTDGVTEAFNAAEEAYGEERLRKLVRENRTMPVQDLLDLLLADIRGFAGTAPQSDDITVVIIRAD